MNTCPNCGGAMGLHSSVLPGCMCQYTGPRERFENHAVKLKWVGLTDEEISNLWCKVSNTDFVTIDTHEFARAIEDKLRSKNT